MCQGTFLTCAIKANETIASARVELQACVCKQLLAMEGKRQAGYVDIRAVRVGGQNTGHCPCLSLRQFKFIQLLCQMDNTYTNKRKEWPVQEEHINKNNLS